MAAIFIDDGYTVSKVIPGEPGLFPQLEVVYRPALARKRLDYQKVVGGNDPAKIDAAEGALLEEHVVKLNGDPLPAGKAARIVPKLRVMLLDLVLGYTAADEAADRGN